MLRGRNSLVHTSSSSKIEIRASSPIEGLFLKNPLNTWKTNMKEENKKMEIEIKRISMQELELKNMGFCLWKVSELIQHFI